MFCTLFLFCRCAGIRHTDRHAEEGDERERFYHSQEGDTRDQLDLPSKTLKSRHEAEGGVSQCAEQGRRDYQSQRTLKIKLQ